MAYINTTRATGFNLIERAQEFFAVAAENTAKRRVYNETIRELNMLTQRELADLGISRSGIKAIAIEAAYGN